MFILITLSRKRKQHQLLRYKTKKGDTKSPIFYFLIPNSLINSR
ncbi:hypothetical protein NMS_1298 [Nonlabens marinus S1-08]|uniref:Uncharacterized protein n=1 Tax=Nonlabens marinus S1-08 TaxID=1454201 RepID=W8VX49_9FLAO|nr:hypothetical protein NMS_1298 [Nonlabens marinus S1-08]